MKITKKFSDVNQARSVLDSAPLGTNTNLRNPPLSKADLQVKKWALQAASRECLKAFSRVDSKGHRQQKYRVSFCCRRATDISVKIRNKAGKHHYTGVMKCGSVWTCPVCGAVISERRRGELVQGIDNWEKQGGKVVMLTQTIPHYETESLKHVLESFMKARRLQRNRKPWKRFIGQYLEGTVTALEVTHGANGWHVHSHEILFLNQAFADDKQRYEVNNKQIFKTYQSDYMANLRIDSRLPKHPFHVSMQNLLYNSWADACSTVGIGKPSKANGVDLTDGAEMGNYVSKWGIDHELTKAHLKNSKNERSGRTPWAILQDYLEFGFDEDRDLFRTFAEEFRGSQQLRWSRGLKDLLQITDLDDDQIMKESDAGTEVISLPLETWREIVKRDLRATVLNVADESGSQYVKIYLESLNIGSCVVTVSGSVPITEDEKRIDYELDEPLLPF